MATLKARGCRACSLDIALMEETMNAPPEGLTVIDTSTFRSLQPQQRILLDGEDQAGQGVYAAILGGNGALLRNVRVELPNGRYSFRLCSCGSEDENAMVELWYGKVELEEIRPLIYATR